MTKTEVLCMGFSVTEMGSSYVNRAVEICETDGLPIDFIKCGIGGIGCDTLAYIIEEILDNFETIANIIFEIATGDGRDRFVKQRSGNNDLLMLRWIQEITDAALRRGKSIGFINFPRLETDGPFDPLELTIFAVGQIRHVPVRSLFWQIVDEGSDLPSMLTDVVHVSPVGADYYARSLISFFNDGLSKGGGRISSQRRFGSRRFALDSSLPAQRFERYGFSCDMVQVRPMQRLTSIATEAVRFEGVSFLSGPRVGGFAVFVDDNWVGEFQAYDPYCYYTRFNTRFFEPAVGTTLTVEIFDRIPDIPLLKGEPSFEERLIGFGHAMYSNL